jgi:HAD superfamily hydrolase (TIGR01509 family)
LPHFIGGPDEQVASELASIAPVPVKPEDILRAKQEHFHKQFLKIDRVSLRPGFLPFLEWLTRMGIVIAIGTVSEREFAKVLLNRSGASRHFPGLRLVAREDVEHPKPAPDVYIKTAELCGVSCPQQLVFEDSPVGVRAAKLAKCRIIAIPVVHTAILERRLAQEGAEAIFPTWDNPELKTRALDIISTQS